MLILIVLDCYKCFAQREYLDEVFKIIEQHSINKLKLDFAEIKAEAYNGVDNLYSVEDCYPVVRRILLKLNDHHSFFMTREQVKAWQGRDITTRIEGSPPFSGKVLEDNIGYINVGGFSSGDSLSVLTYANKLQS